MVSPAISVVIPAYNAARWLDRAIGSVLRQTMTNLETIVVDDGSNDATGAIAAHYAREDSRIRVRTLHKNQGLPNARNVGFEMARAPWVALLDADDAMLPERLEQQVAFATSHPSVAAFAGLGRYMGANGRETRFTTEALPLTTVQEYAAWMENNWHRPIALNAPSTVVNRDKFFEAGGFRHSHDGAEDLDLWNRLAERWPVLQHHDVVTLYRMHSASAMSARALECWRTAEYTVACIKARRRGEPEPSSEEFEAWHQATLWRRLAQHRRINGLATWRKGASSVANNEWIKAALFLSASTVLCPRYAAGRLWAFGFNSKDSRRAEI